MVGLSITVLGLVAAAGGCKSPDLSWRMEAEAYLDQVEVKRPFSSTSTLALSLAFQAAERGYRDFVAVIAEEPVLKLLTGRGPCLGDYLDVLTCPPFRPCVRRGIFDRIAELAPPETGLLAALRAAQTELLLAYTVSEAYLTRFEGRRDLRFVVCRLVESVGPLRDQSLADARGYLTDAQRAAKILGVDGPTTAIVRECESCLSIRSVGECVVDCQLPVPELGETRACTEADEPY